MKFEPEDELFGHNPDSQILVWMKPSEFLDKASKLSQRHWKSSSVIAVVDKLADKMKKNVPIDPLFLDIDTVSCTVVGHEGRHRAVAAEKAGIRRVPVIMYLMDNKKNYIPVKEYMKQMTATKNGAKCNYFDAQRQK